MTLAQLRSRFKIRVNDLNEKVYTNELIDAVINEGLRVMACETLLLEESNASLTYSSPGFTLPTDFIKVRFLRWATSNNFYSEIEPTSLEFVYKKRNDYAASETTSSDVIIPRYYAIDQGQIILDSITEDSPALYYYKYDTALSADANSPTFNSEHHQYLIDYVTWNLTGDDVSRMAWLTGLRIMMQTKAKYRNARIRHRSF